GKTTLLKCLLGLVFPDSGEIQTDSRAGYMPQVPLFPKNLKVREILKTLSVMEKKETVFQSRLLEELEVGKFQDRYFGELSGGMKQKVNIVQCFGTDRKTYVIDEPTASLDPHMSVYLKNLIRERKRGGASVLFTSHIMSEVEEVADSVALLVDGRLILHETPDEILKKSGAKDMESALHVFWLKAGNHV
ncbi:MAG TPA: ABC transporter ATP-binding protein, partial [Leptospiraceae bacterium]|nr:ABC transporter ATP-binding protein [Leptospiraceae bacterium]